MVLAAGDTLRLDAHSTVLVFVLEKAGLFTLPGQVRSFAHLLLWYRRPVLMAGIGLVVAIALNIIFL